MNENNTITNTNTASDKECIDALTNWAGSLYQAGFNKGMILGISGSIIGALLGAAAYMGAIKLCEKFEEKSQSKD